jgi:hypothetical protein
MKQISIKTKKDREAAADDWVKSRNTIGTEEASSAEGGKMKRLTIDVSEDLHRRIKSFCANNGRIMADEIRSILEREFPKA